MTVTWRVCVSCFCLCFSEAAGLTEGGVDPPLPPAGEEQVVPEGEPSVPGIADLWRSSDPHVGFHPETVQTETNCFLNGILFYSIFFLIHRYCYCERRWCVWRHLMIMFKNCMSDSISLSLFALYFVKNPQQSNVKCAVTDCENK